MDSLRHRNDRLVRADFCGRVGSVADARLVGGGRSSTSYRRAFGFGREGILAAAAEFANMNRKKNL